MVVQIRFPSIRFAVSVRVSEVYEDERVVDGPRAHLTGWAHQAGRPGFRLLGRTTQLRFYREIWHRFAD